MEKELREKYIQTQYIEKQVKQVTKQLEQLDEQSSEITQIVSDLEELKGVKPGSEILVPIHNGIFLKATLNDSENVVINVGSNTTTLKKVQEAQDLLTKQADEIKGIRLKLTDTYEQLTEQARMLESEVKEVIRKYEDSNV